MFNKAASRSDVARARLRALAPAWVPTPELVERELAAARAQEPARGVHAMQAPHDLEQRVATTPTGPRDDRLEAFELQRSPARGFVLLLAGALVGALAVLLMGWPRGETAPIEVSPIKGPTREQGSGATTSEAPQTATEDVIVDVAGLVKRPGVVELPSGSRVIDALEAAGGVRPRGDTSSLNLAQLLTDGQQVLVVGQHLAAPPGTSAPTLGTTAGVPSGGLVSINSATLEQLDTLPGIGLVLAQAIIDWRTENGGFTAIEQLQEVSGIGEATYADISGLVGL